MRRAAWLWILLLLLASACAGPAPLETQGLPATGGERLRVAATTTIAADVVRQVGGDAVEVSSLLPVGADPHSFQPAPQDIARLGQAQLIFAAGAGLEEGFLDRLVESAGAADHLVDLSEGISLQEFTAVNGAHAGEEEEHAGEGDPHVWFDPANVKIWAENAAGALAQADPERGDEYRQRAAEYTAELDALDEWIAAQVEQIPPGRRIIVTDHSLLGYFAARYGFELAGAIVPGYSSASSPSAKELAALEDSLEASGAPAVFTSNTVNPELAERVAEDTGVELVTLYTGSLTEPGGPAATYLDYMRANVQALVEALR